MCLEQSYHVCIFISIEDKRSPYVINWKTEFQKVSFLPKIRGITWTMLELEIKLKSLPIKPVLFLEY